MAVAATGLRVPSARRPRRWVRVPAVAAISPALVWYAAFMIAPLVGMFVLSLFEWDNLLATPTFAGPANFERVLTDPIVRTAAVNSILYVGVSLVVMIPLAFLLGYFLSRKPPGYRILSVIFFTPGIVSVSARAMMFTGVYQPEGILNKALVSLRLGGLSRNWLADEHTALWAIIGVEVWAGIGFTGVIFAAALTAIPEEIFEAARLDGATTWAIIWRVAYPMTRDFVGLMTMLQFLWLLLVSAQNVLLLTQGGPGSSSMTLSYYLFDQAFVSTRMGYSQAIGVVLFIVGFAGMLLIRGAFRTKET
jgi:multiple sugar transport system permease protein